MTDPFHPLEDLGEPDPQSLRAANVFTALVSNMHVEQLRAAEIEIRAHAEATDDHGAVYYIDMADALDSYIKERNV